MQLNKDNLFSLVITGAPGGTRVLMLLLAGYFFDPEFKEAASNLLFILLSVNLICSQSISSLLYNNKYKQQALSLLIFSIPFIILSVLFAFCLSYFSNEELSLGFLLSVVSMHFYTYARFFAISIRSLQNAFFSEIAVFLIVISYFLTAEGNVDSFFYCISLAYFTAALIMVNRNKNAKNEIANISEPKLGLLKKVINLALSNVSSSMVLYLIPFYFALFSVGDKVHEIALLISIISTILLIPRVYANKEISKVSGYKENELIVFNSKYNKISFLSGALGVVVCVTFSIFKDFSISPFCFLILPILVVFTQINFVYSMYLSSHGSEKIIRNVHLFVIMAVAMGLIALQAINSVIVLSNLETYILLIISFSLFLRGKMFKKCFINVFKEKAL